MKLPSAKDHDGTEWAIGEESYLVKVVKRIPDASADTVGLCDPSTQTIWLKRGQSRAALFRTWVHELLHAIEAEAGIDLKHKDIYTLERGIADALLMNGLLIGPRPK